MTTTTNTPAAHAFDFLRGHWHIHNRRLRLRLQQCTDWETFDATQFNQTLPGGIGNFDDFVADTWRPGFVGCSLRIFSPVTQLWSIYWLDNQTGGLKGDGQLLPAVVGGFVNGVGIFECDDTLNGQAIRVRYTWSDITANTARWQQAMSADGGKTWEMNWQMDMRRQIPDLV